VEGRSTEQKHDLIRNLSHSMSETLGVPLERIRVAIYEITADEWGIGGEPFSVARPGGVTPPSP